jgi:hypothetical protein
MQGLVDADEELEVLRTVERGVLLHGHLHTRIHRTIPTDRGHIDAIGSTSASLVDDDGDRMSGFNLYEIDEGGLVQVEAHRYDGQGFVPTPVPQVELAS